MSYKKNSKPFSDSISRQAISTYGSNFNFPDFESYMLLLRLRKERNLDKIFIMAFENRRSPILSFFSKGPIPTEKKILVIPQNNLFNIKFRPDKFIEISTLKTQEELISVQPQSISRELFNIIRPARTIRYSESKLISYKQNYRRFRPEQGSRILIEFKRTGYFYANNPATSFYYELGRKILNRNFPILKPSIKRTSSHVSYRVNYDHLADAEIARLQKLKGNKLKTIRLKKKQKLQDEEEYGIFRYLYNIGIEIFDLTGFKFIFRVLRQYFSDSAITESAVVAFTFNIIFFFSDYFAVWIYIYFPFFLNIITSTTTSLAPGTYVYQNYFLLFLSLFPLYYFFYLFISNNIIYRLFPAFLFVMFLNFFLLDFIFSFPVFKTVFIFGLVMFFLLFYFALQSLQFFYDINSSTNFAKQNFLRFFEFQCIGYYKSDYFFQIWPVRINYYMIFWFYNFANLARVSKKEQKIALSKLKKKNFFKLNFFKFKKSKKIFSGSYSFAMPPMFSPPIYYPNIFREFKANDYLTYNTDDPDLTNLIEFVPRFEIDMGQTNNFSVDQTVYRQFSRIPSTSTLNHIDYLTEEPQSAYQTLFFSDQYALAENAEDDTHTQGYWYPSYVHPTFKTTYSHFYPFAFRVSQFNSFYKYYNLRLFILSLYQSDKAPTPQIGTFYKFVFAETADILKNAKTFKVFNYFSAFENHFINFPPFFRRFILLSYFIINLFFVNFNYFLSILFRVFYLGKERTKNFDSPTPSLLRIFIFPTSHQYKFFIRFYFKCFGSNSKIPSNFIFFFTIFFFLSPFIELQIFKIRQTPNFYFRIYMASKTYVIQYINKWFFN